MNNKLSRLSLNKRQDYYIFFLLLFFLFCPDATPIIPASNLLHRTSPKRRNGNSFSLPEQNKTRERWGNSDFHYDCVRNSFSTLRKDGCSLVSRLSSRVNGQTTPGRMQMHARSRARNTVPVLLLALSSHESLWTPGWNENKGSRDEKRAYSERKYLDWNASSQW